MNLPNKLTILRIALTFIFIILLNLEGLFFKIASAVVFIIASVTDYLDGYYAKKYKLTSDFGILMDPIADKFLLLSAFLSFCFMGIVEFWMFVVILIREVLITCIRLVLKKKGIVIAAEKLGKYKTVSQITAIIFILIFIILKNYYLDWPQNVINGWQYFIDALMYITVFLTLISGASFFVKNKENICLGGGVVTR